MGIGVRTTWIALATLAWVVSAVPAAPPPPGPQVTTIDGTEFRAPLRSIDSQAAVFQAEPRNRSVPLRDLLEIRFAVAKNLMAERGRKVVVFTDGGRLGVDRFTVGKGRIVLESKLLGRLSVDLTAVAEVYMPGPKQTPAAIAEKFAEIRQPPGGEDRLIARNETGGWVPVAGALRSADAERVVFGFGGADKSIKLSSVRVIQLARVPRETASPIGRLIGADGSVLPLASLRFDGTELVIDACWGEQITVALKRVAAIRLQSDRGVYLSDLKPVKILQLGMFDVAFPFRNDRSVAGGPIRLGRRTYAKGLGLHSHCELTYELSGQFDRFAARAGIDAAAGKRGSATLRLLGDGKDLLSPIKLSGRAGPVVVRCSLAGVKSLTIIVEFGDDGTDVGDHVDLAGARLIKP